MERQGLYSERRAAHVQHVMGASSPKRRAIEEKPLRPLPSSAMASPYRIPISPASFYASPTHSTQQSHSQDTLSHDAQPKQTSPNLHNKTGDDSRDEIDFLTPATSLHDRMRGKAPSNSSQAHMGPTAAMRRTSALTKCVNVRLRAVFVGQEYASRNEGVEVVAFQTHLTLFHRTTACAKVAFRDVLDTQLGGKEHALIAMSIKQKCSSARAIASLCGEAALDPCCLYMFVEPNDTSWPLLFDQVRTYTHAEKLTESACMALFEASLRSNTKTLRIPSSPSAHVRKPTPIVIGERRTAAMEKARSDESTKPTCATDAAELVRSSALTNSITAEPAHPIRYTRERTRLEVQQRKANQSKPILRYPASGPFAVTLLQSDVERLQEGEYLNDTLIEFGLRYLLERIKQKEPNLAQQIHVFNTFFYHKLTESRDRSKTYEHVRKWTNKVDMYVFITYSPVY